MIGVPDERCPIFPPPRRPSAAGPWFLTRYHTQVHETVYLLAETDQRATDSLAGFARWIGRTL
jgi:hypothetical protein